jgi:predicted O-methyltransferase YrrM
MDQAVEAVLAAYETREKAEIKMMREVGVANALKNQDDLLLAIGSRTGRLLNVLIKDMKAQTIVECGTSYGYSTIWLAEAARATGGKVYSLEIHPKKQEYAKVELQKAGLADYVELILGNAPDSIAALPGPFDFVLIDLWKDLYIPCLDLAYPKLSAGAVIAADNMVRTPSPPDALAYRRHVRAKQDIDSVLLPVGSGVELSRYKAGL